MDSQKQLDNIFLSYDILENLSRAKSIFKQMPGVSAETPGSSSLFSVTSHSPRHGFPGSDLP